ncbi:MAG TPA: PrgI family protein [Spirochaetia bacterium]|nr:PrgI family protein [Spirochaetia bacterium]
MAYVPVPKDMNAVKTKVMFNLTKRQLICFGSGAAIGVPLFFLLKPHISVSAAAICMVVVMLPFFLLAMYEKNGQPLEKILRNIIQVSLMRPKQRPYATNNFYDLLQRQDSLDKEVYRIVNGKAQTQPRRQARDRSSHSESEPHGQKA